MKSKVSLMILFGVMVAFEARAAGTYYSGNYSSPQRNYATSAYATRGQNMNYSRDTTYTRTRTVTPNSNAYVGGAYQNYTRVVGTQPAGTNVQQTSGAQTVRKQSNNSGFYLNAGISHEFAAWNLDMNVAGSKLHYDNIRWNVFDVGIGYKFGASTPVQIDAGFKYGVQFGDSTMVDDDITNGGYVVTKWNDWNDANNNHQIDDGELTYIGTQIGNSLSIGSSSSGNLMEFNAGLGLTDVFKVGGARITPSIGYRYLRHKLETKNDYGLTVDTGYCETVNGGDETQCDPIVIFYNSSSNTQEVIWDHLEGSGGYLGDYWYWAVPAGDNYVSNAGTYMFKLPGVSHSYETTWAGPYVAMDLNYDINIYNTVNARLEFGLPMYTSTGDQPYRPDWQHPKSVEDKGGFGDAWHIGFGANYATALTESVSLSLGFTFDYYSLSGGEANTYWNSTYWTTIYNEILAEYLSAGLTETDMLNGYTYEGVSYGPDPTAVNIAQKRDSGWVTKVDNEIESIYKSLGMRVGIVARF